MPALNFKVYIPARYESTRLPGKLLLEVKGRTILEYVYRNACASGAAEVIIATDHHEIEIAAKAFGAEVVMTKPQHVSGTDRIAEAVGLCDEHDEQIIVNVQGDEPLLPPQVIQQVATLLDENSDASIATLCEEFAAGTDLADPNICKVVSTISQRAMYFSRAPIPFCRESGDRALHRSAVRRHIGIYAYRVGFLRRFVELPTSRLEQIEKLEQLRALENNFDIVVADACDDCGFGIDTQIDFDRFQAQLH